MAGGDTGAVSAAGRDTGVRILDCMRAAADTHCNLDTHCHCHCHCYPYSYAHTFSNPGAYLVSDPNSSSPGADPNAYPNVGASGTHIL